MDHNILWLAPMLGFTEYPFRNVYGKHFQGIDAAVMPFVTLVEGRNVKIAHIKDVWREHNDSVFRLVPQVLGNDGSMFVTMNKRLWELGYDEVNWNLGCPAPRVVSHMRGSGLLPFPERIEQVLETVFQNPKLNISVKLRLGHKSPTEIEKVLPILNRFPLKSICLHPRVGIQMYGGSADCDVFKYWLPQIQYPVIYNGDIFSASDFQRLKNQLPQVNQWMLGRGIFYDPFLPEKITGIFRETPESAKKRFEDFHMELFEAVLKRSNIEKNALNKMKEYWMYYKNLYENGSFFIEKLKRCQSLSEMQELFSRIYRDEPFSISIVG